MSVSGRVIGELVSSIHRLLPMQTSSHGANRCAIADAVWFDTFQLEIGKVQYINFSPYICGIKKMI